MRRYLLDTNALSDLINQRRGVHARTAVARRRGDKIGTCVPVVGEYHFGLELSASRDENLKRLRAGIRKLTVWPFDLAAAREYGRLQAALRRTGRPMQQIDVQLAVIALSLGNCTVVSSDTDLSAVPGLAVENWAA